LRLEFRCGDSTTHNRTGIRRSATTAGLQPGAGSPVTIAAEAFWHEFLQQHNCRSQEKNAERIAAIRPAIPAIQDQAVQEACVLITHSLVAMLTTLRAQIAIFDRRIAELVVDCLSRPDA
jgi:hypothetical protein